MLWRLTTDIYRNLRNLYGDSHLPHSTSSYADEGALTIARSSPDLFLGYCEILDRYVGGVDGIRFVDHGRRMLKWSRIDTWGKRQDGLILVFALSLRDPHALEIVKRYRAFVAKGDVIFNSISHYFEVNGEASELVVLSLSFILATSGVALYLRYFDTKATVVETLIVAVNYIYHLFDALVIFPPRVKKVKVPRDVNGWRLLRPIIPAKLMQGRRLSKFVRCVHLRLMHHYYTLRAASYDPRRNKMIYLPYLVLPICVKHELRIHAVLSLYIEALSVYMPKALCLIIRDFLADGFEREKITAMTLRISWYGTDRMTKFSTSVDWSIGRL